jgi:hypothetical protein
VITIALFWACLAVCLLPPIVAHKLATPAIISFLPCQHGTPS